MNKESKQLMNMAMEIHVLQKFGEDVNEHLFEFEIAAAKSDFRDGFLRAYEMIKKGELLIDREEV